MRQKDSLRSITISRPSVVKRSDLVNSYADWLAAHSTNTPQVVDEDPNKAYLSYAMRTVNVGGKEVSTFAPFRQKLSAIQTITRGQIVLLLLCLLLLIVGVVLFGMQMLVAGIAVITVLYLGDLALSFIISLQTLHRSAEERIDDALVHSLAGADWPLYTILCPLYKEARVVPQFVKAMQSLDYPAEKLQILFLTEQDDEETRNAILAMGLAPHFKVVTVPDGEPRTKPRACNFGLLLTRGDYVVIYDAEDIPDPLQLKKAVLTFAHSDPTVACVQAKLNFYNKNQNLLTRWFTAEYSLWFDLTLPGLQKVGFPLPLGGTSNHFRTELLRTLGAWDPFNVTEDCDLGLRLARYGLRTAMLDSTTYEEATSRVKNWLRQRSRWIKGYMQTYLVYMRQPQHYLSRERFREFLSLQLIIGGKTGVLFVNPIMWLLVVVYILLHTVVDETYRTLFPVAILYMGTICLVFGNFFYAYAHLVGCFKRRDYSLIKWTFLIPIYWALNSIAAFIALYQLIFKPHYWEKTQHGFHLVPDIVQEPIAIQHSTKAPALSTTTTIAEEASVVQKSQPVEELEVSSILTASEKMVPVGAASAHSSAIEISSTPVERKPSFWFNDLELEDLTSYLDEEELLPIPTVTESLKTIKIVPAPHAAIEQYKKTFVERVHRPNWLKDPWLIATWIVACLASVLSLWYFFQQHQLLTYGDSYSHMLIARRTFDSLTPGLAQLGGVWLPLPHLLMLPFIWNNYLWHTGLAGSFASMPCYVIAAIYLYLAGRRLTKDSRASFLGALVFILNPNVLYLQTTPLSEIVLIATLTMACYHFLAWAQENSPRQLILAAAGTLLATMSRYDGWFLFLALLAFIIVIGLLKRQRLTQIEGNLLIFASFGGVGIVLWLLWCGAIFGDPLYWQHGPFSSQAQQLSLIKLHILYTYHDLWQSLRYFGLDSSANVGPFLFVLGILGFLVFVARRRISVETIATLAFITPFIFYVVSLFTGQAALYVTDAVPATAPNGLYNARYGVQSVMGVALFVAFLGSLLPHLFPRPVRSLRIANSSSRLILKRRLFLIGRRYLGLLLFVPLIIGQTAWTFDNGIISLQDGLYGLDCAPHHEVVIYLAQHYNGGRILEDTFTSPEPGVDFKNVIYEGSNVLWNKAIKNPAALVDWVIVDPTNKNDLLAVNIDVHSQEFLTHFERVVQEPKGLELYHRKGLPPVPTYSVDESILNQHELCGTGGPKKAGHTALSLNSFREK